MKSYLIRILQLLTLWFCLSMAYADNSASFIALSDIHFNPLAACINKPKPCALAKQLQNADPSQWQNLFAKQGVALAKYGQDSNYALVKVSLDKLRILNTEMHPQFVIVLGDFLVHDFQRKYIQYTRDKSNAHFADFVAKTMRFMALQLAQTFPGIDIYNVVGNNDSFAEHYHTVFPFFKTLQSTWGPLLRDQHNRQRFQQDFATGGYYAVTLPHQPTHRLLVLNTVLFSSKAKGNGVSAAAQAELAWLTTQLQQAQQKHQKVIIAAHIPMGLDEYFSLSPFGLHFAPLWQKKFHEQFYRILNQYSDVLAGVILGHLHYSAHANLTLNNGVILPLYQVPSISPIFGNKPGFEVFYYDKSDLKITSNTGYEFLLDYATPGVKWWHEIKPQ